jgi:uncharacterized membrane protein
VSGEEDGAASSASTPSQSIEPPPLPPVRLAALADGVFAIAMTLLVLELVVPVVAADNAELTGLLVEMWPEFLMYVLSFLVLGVYWLIHQMIFGAIERYDTTLIWLNIVFLMFAAFIPFSTALIVVHGAMAVTAVFYGMNVLAVFLMGWAMWTYASSNHRLVASSAIPDLGRRVRTIGLVYLAVSAVPLALAFVSPVASIIVYAVMVLAVIGLTVIGGRGIVTALPLRRHR